MGMYTTVVFRPPLAGEELDIQFKTGGDYCDKYRVGDTVNWWVDKSYVGRAGLLDGVYEGFSHPWDPQLKKHVNPQNWWVCIKDHKIVEVVEQAKPGLADDQEGDNSHPQFEQKHELHFKYGIPKEDPRELWTQAAWEQHDEMREICNERMAREEAAGIDPINSFTRQAMRQPGFFRQIMPGYEEPTEITAEDGRVFQKGEQYKHFDRVVTLDRIYTEANTPWLTSRTLVGIRFPKGSYLGVPVEELKELTDAEMVAE